MNCVGAGFFRGVEDLTIFRYFGPPEKDRPACVVGLAHVQRGAIGLGINHDRFEPDSRHARITRTAISPRLAINIRLNMGEDYQMRLVRLQGDIAMLRAGSFRFVFQRPQCRDKARTGVARHHDLIDIAQLGGLERIGEALAIFIASQRSARSAAAISLRKQC